MVWCPWGGSVTFTIWGSHAVAIGFYPNTVANETIDLLPYQVSDALKPFNETNLIGILAKDNSFEFYINREKVGSVSDTNIEEGGNFGFLTMSSGTPNFKTLIERLEYWD